MHNRTSLTLIDPLALCTLRRHKKSLRRSCIDSRIGMLSYSVASPCQTLRDQLVWRPRVNVYSWFSLQRFWLVHVLVLSIMIHHSYTQTLREFNSLYKEAVRSDFNLLNGLMEYNNKPFTYSYQCHEATFAFANALNNTIAGLFYIILNQCTAIIKQRRCVVSTSCWV